MAYKTRIIWVIYEEWAKSKDLYLAPTPTWETYRTTVLMAAKSKQDLIEWMGNTHPDCEGYYDEFDFFKDAPTRKHIWWEPKDYLHYNEVNDEYIRHYFRLHGVPQLVDQQEEK